MNHPILEKIASRKLLLSLAAFLASVGAGLAGIADPTTCTVLCVLSAAIYAACEAYVDGQSAKSTTTSVSATTNSRETVEKILGGEQ